MSPRMLPSLVRPTNPPPSHSSVRPPPTPFLRFRTSVLLQLYRCGLILPAADFVQLYFIAVRGSSWKTGAASSDTLVQVWGETYKSDV